MHGDYQNRPNQVKNEVAKTPTVPVEETAIESPADKQPKVAATVEPQISEKKDVLAVVTGCASLIVREKPNKLSGIITIIPVGSEIMVDLKHSTDIFYKICNAAGIEGFCMKQYIETRP